MKNTFDSIGYTTYTFLYLEDLLVLSKTHTLDSYFTSDNGNTFAMTFFDETAGKAGGIKTIKTPNSFSNLVIIKEIKQKARYEVKILYL